MLALLYIKWEEDKNTKPFVLDFYDEFTSKPLCRVYSEEI